MTEEKQPDHGESDLAGLRAWAAVAVRQAHELWPHARKDPQSAALRLVTEHLATVEKLLPAEDPARAAVVPWLGLLMKAQLKGRPHADPRERAAALSHLRWTDRARPLNDRLAMMARGNLAELLIPPGIPPEVRDGSGPPALAESLREQLTEALNVLARIVAGDLTTRESMVAVMESVATMLSSLPGRPGGSSPSPPQEGNDGEEAAGPASALPCGEPVEEALADALQGAADWARRDAVGFAHLLEWMCVTVNDFRVSMADASRELAALGLDQPEFTPLRDLLAALRSGGQDLPSLVGRVHGAAQAAGKVLHALPADAPERIRVAKFHAALLVAGNLRMPETLDFGEVDAAAMRPDPDPAARSAWRRELSLELILSTSIDNLWVSNGEIARVERSVAWLREWIDALPADGKTAAATRRFLTALLAHRVATAARLGGSLQDGVAALSMAKGLSASDEHDDVQALFSLLTGFQLAHRSRDQAALARATEDLIQTLSDRYASPAPDAGTRFVITGTLGLAHGERAARTGDQADLRAAARYLREAVEIDPATVPPLFAPYFPATRAQLMTELARADPRREVIDRAIAEVHRVIEESRTSPWDEARLRLALGQAMLRATTHRSDLSLLDPCIAELSRVRALAAEGHGPPLNVEVLTELSAAHWMSAVTGGPRASEDRKASLDTRREALELMAADVLLQLGAEHSLSVARAATGHVLWLALRCAEDRRPAEAVEALELGRALVLQTAAAAHGVPGLLADRGHSDLAERWRAQAPRHPLQGGPGEGDRTEGARTEGDAGEWDPVEGDQAEGDPLRPRRAAVVTSALGAELPSSLRRKALAALGAGNGTGARELLGTPDTAALTAALAASGADALVYLLPGEGFRPHIPGRALILRPGGAEPAVLALPLLLSPGSHQLERYLAAAADRSRKAAAPDASRAAREAAETEWKATLSELCDWAWPAAVGPVLDSLEPLGRPPRIVLIPCGPLGVVPWHAARKHIPLGGYSYACQDAVFSYAPSGAQFLRAAARDRLPATGRRVLVTDPRLSLVWAEIETEALRSACYPDARRYGEFVAAEGVPDAPGSCEDLLAVLPGGGQPAAVVHVSCHGVAGPSPTRSALSLADGELTVARILDHAAAPGPDGPLVVLSACETDLSTGDHDEALTLSTALVARGAADVVGSRWAVNDSATALMMAVFHHFLTSEDLAPADALRAAQLWMLNPDRRPPPGLRDPLHREAARADLHETHLWAAFTHQGNPAAR
ncbi:CHAT domain-containing protein [Streptomyces sp. FXJ1.172]|uniref:CHAT domain-containing protein n=1 Tax=Streptomyces sp. FXJ1.172 TaxID=710705 RepID=UPI0007CF7271|nr:CHAT domain-containing protein [Streptomyces sp. FXJ1.172]WEO93430.1 CHAT domain-containing protein [Streptomyces sp. FXJ1.172]